MKMRVPRSPTRRRTRQWLGRRRTSPTDRDRGSAAVETPIAVGALFLVIVFVVGATRIMTHEGEMASAARAGARAAAAARNPAEAQQRASAAVTEALGKSACAGAPGVQVIGWAPGATVRVEVTCMTDLNGLQTLYDGNRDVTVSAVEYVDLLRGVDD